MVYPVRKNGVSPRSGGTCSVLSSLRSMITIQDLYNILSNKISNEMQKAIIRNNCPPQIAERMCDAIDGQEKAEHFQRLLQEYNEWLINQQRQQAMVQQFLREYYK